MPRIVKILVGRLYTDMRRLWTHQDRQKVHLLLRRWEYRFWQWYHRADRPK